MTYIDLRCGDSYFVLLDFPDNTFDSVVCIVASVFLLRGM